MSKEPIGTPNQSTSSNNSPLTGTLPATTPTTKGKPTNPSSSGPSESTGPGDEEIRAKFIDDDARTQSSLLNMTKPQSSPLLSSTPPTVAKSLIKAYPYLLIVNKSLSIVTWTNDDYWINLIIISLYCFVILYFETLVTWFGHIIIVTIITLYALLNNKIIEETNLHPTLDDVVQALTTTCIKADILLSPITSLSLTAYDIKRLLFTTVFLTPVYLIITFLIVKPRTILLIVGFYLLTYHSTYSRVTRKLIWRIKLARLLCFYLTGLDFSQARNHSLFAAAFAKVQKNNNLFNGDFSSGGMDNKPVRFTYVLYENQRRWLGIGWTSNLLSYERTAWTDEFLNESSSIDSFQLPNPGDSSFTSSQHANQLSLNGAKWRWVDKTWRLDLTNDGAITLPNNKRSKTTANPTSDEGFIFTDNTWKKPSTEDSYSKYTRRRRWIRTAELVFENSNEVSSPNTTLNIEEDVSSVGGSASTGVSTTEDTTKRRKSLRFAESDEIEKPLLQDLELESKSEKAET